MTGIYKIENKENGKVYIGSSKNTKRRFSDHRYALNKHQHHSYKLQNDWDKYGEDAFEFVELKECDFYDLLKYEDEYIKKYDSILHGYNVAKIVVNGNFYKQYCPKIHLEESVVKKIVVALLYYENDRYLQYLIDRKNGDTSEYSEYDIETFNEGRTGKIAEELGVDKNHVSMIRHFKKYKDIYDEIDSEYYDLEIDPESGGIFELIEKYFSPDDKFYRDKVVVRYNILKYGVDYDVCKLSEEMYNKLMKDGTITPIC